MVINTNSSALNAARLLGQSYQALRKSVARLSSGSKIESPEDDAAGLSESTKLNNESLRHKAALDILQNSVSFLQTKDGYLQKVQKALDRMSELSMLAQDATKTDLDRDNYDKEFQTLKALIDDVGRQSFNGKSLFYSEYSVITPGGAITWTAAKADAESKGGHLATITSPGEQNYISLQIGAIPNTWIGATDEVTEGNFKWVTGEAFIYSNWNAGEPNNSGNEDYAHLLGGSLKWNDFPADAGVTAYLLETGPRLVVNGDGDKIGLPTGGIPYISDSLTTSSAALSALTNLKNAIADVAQQRGNVGPMLQRVQLESSSLGTQVENLDASVSRIRDTDVAVESTKLARQSILTQSGTAMLAQANLLPQSVLRLLG